MPFVGFLLIMVGAYLIYAGVKDQHPLTLTQQAIKGGKLP